MSLFFVWPFAAFLLSLKQLNKKSSAIVFILFCWLYGYSFTFVNTSADSFRIALTFVNFEFNSLQDIYFVYIDGGTTDIYRYLVYGITKIYTDNPKFLYSFFGLTFGVFWYFAALIFIKEKGKYTGFYIGILFAIFILINPITYVNGARFNTAMWVFFCAAYNVLILNKKSWVFGLLITPLIHFSFLFALPVIFLYYFFQKITYNKKRVYLWVYILFILTFCISWVLDTNTIKLDFVGDGLSSSISNKVSAYNSNEMTEVYRKRGSNSLFLKVSRSFGAASKINFFLLILLIQYQLKSVYSGKKKVNQLLSFVMIFYSFSYVASLIPSGARFVAIANMFALLLLLNTIKLHSGRLMKILIFLLLATFSFRILFQVYLNLSIVSMDLWFNNFFFIVIRGLGYELPI